MVGDEGSGRNFQMKSFNKIVPRGASEGSVNVPTGFTGFRGFRGLKGFTWKIQSLFFYVFGGKLIFSPR